MDYPLEMRTERALGTLGRLIFDWAENARSLPQGSREEAGRVVIGVSTFHQLMAAEGLVHGDPEDKDAGDYAIRADVTEVELIRRTPQRASILLPEPQIVSYYRETTDPVEAPVVRLYKRMADAHATGTTEQLTAVTESNDHAVYGKVTLTDDPLEAFIYPNTGYYSCSQCI